MLDKIGYSNDTLLILSFFIVIYIHIHDVHMINIERAGHMEIVHKVAA